MEIPSTYKQGSLVILARTSRAAGERKRGLLAVPVCRAPTVSETRFDGLRWRQNDSKYSFLGIGS